MTRICRELDGMPLAIELAAARAKVLSVDEIALRLDDRFRFLRSGRRLADPRHQTLRAAIDWSYDFLSDDERELLAGLAVFAGGFTLASAGAVCLPADGDRALDLVSALVESSLVVPDGRSGATRYRLLETIRAYAAGRLEDSGAAEQVRRRHAEHFLEVARQASPNQVRFSPDEQQAGLAALERERENLHAAVQWALGADADLALELAAELRPYWVIRGDVRQGLDWLGHALERTAPDASRPRAAALAGAALLARLKGDFARAQSFAEAGLTAARAAEAPRFVVTCLNVLTTLAGLDGDYSRARSYSAEALAVARELESPRLEASTQFILAEAALHCRRYPDVRDAGGRALELARSIGDHEAAALASSRLGMAAVHEGRLDAAARHLREALEASSTLGFPAAAAICCDGLAALAAERGDSLRAARLLGAAEALRRAAGSLLLPAEAEARALALAAVERAVPSAGLADALAAGARLSLPDIVEEARPLAPAAGVTPL